MVEPVGETSKVFQGTGGDGLDSAWNWKRRGSKSRAGHPNPAGRAVCHGIYSPHSIRWPLESLCPQVPGCPGWPRPGATWPRPRLFRTPGFALHSSAKRSDGGPLTRFRPCRAGPRRHDPATRDQSPSGFPNAQFASAHWAEFACLLPPYPRPSTAALSVQLRSAPRKRALVPNPSSGKSI
jgi:hypothetical protein